jgi:hypothetical protein
MSPIQTGVPAPPARDRRQSKHSPRTIALARQLYGDGDSWTPTQIVRYLERNGVQPVPTLGTVRRWVVPGMADAHRELNLRSYHARRAKRHGNGPVQADDPAVRLARLRALRDAGMSYASLAILAAVDFDLQITDDQMRYVLQAPRMTRAVHRHMSKEVVS